jgi:hypothetical protein
MKIEVFCDESHPELFTTTKVPLGQYLMIGSLWLPSEIRQLLKTQIEVLKNKHNVGTEFKWHKVHENKLMFYIELVDLFFSHGDNLRFRCIAVDKNQFKIKLHNDDAELGFYKFYYQLLHHWIRESNEYSIFCDQKTSSDPRRLNKLTEVLQNATPSAYIHPVQALPSWQVSILQFSDFLLGAAAAKKNGKINSSSAKGKVLNHIETLLQREIGPSYKAEKKFNLFCINLRGDW